MPVVMSRRDQASLVTHAKPLQPRLHTPITEVRAMCPLTSFSIVSVKRRMQECERIGHTSNDRPLFHRSVWFNMTRIADNFEMDEYQTWDGEPVSREAPFGVTVVVFRQAASGPEFLLLHRNGEGPDYEGDWAWGPPAGARYPGEDINVCAERELLEEASVAVPLTPVETDTPEWLTYLAEVEPDSEIVLSPEHDRFIWVGLENLTDGVAPEIAREQLRAAARVIMSMEAYSMDDIADYNIRRWRSLAQAGAVFTRPALELDASAARAMVDPEGWLGNLAGRRVLCLASGGGQQSAAFALLGASVTVVDLSEEQLERDRAAASRYAGVIDTIQSDMRDLSCLEPAAFDLVWQPYSLNFVPDASVVFREVTRVLQPGGVYHLHCANPFVHGLTTADWNGEGYALKRPYLDGAAIEYDDEEWVYRQVEPTGEAIPGPREYRHTLSTVVNGLIAHGFVIQRVSDSWAMSPDPVAVPATWDHLTAYAPPWLGFWAILLPETLSWPRAETPPGTGAHNLP